MNHLDLFSGIGGFAIAAEAAGFRTVGFSEIDPYASKILKKHWPEIPNYGDVRNITQESVDFEKGGTKGNSTAAIDLVTGGFP